MIKEFVPYELAVKLKELGFDEPCFGYYDNGVFIFWYDSKQETELLLNCTAPTFSQAFRWFREKYDLPSNLELLEIGWDYVIYLDDGGEDIDYGDAPFKTYEEAELACLNKLIEIVQGGNNE